MTGFLESVKTYLASAAAGRGQKTAAWEAAVAVDKVEAGYGDLLRGAFWGWLQKGGWLTEEKPLEWRLPDERYLSEEKIRQHYPTLAYKQAVQCATAAWEARVRRCADHLMAGWPVEECLCFVYTREELQHALQRAGRKAA